MIVEIDGADYASLIAGDAPRDFTMAETPIEGPDVLRMLAGVDEGVRQHFVPASWLIVEEGKAVGLCSIVRPPSDGEVYIGYGIAPSERSRGIAGRAIAEVVAWAKGDDRVDALKAETSVGNIPSHKVLERNGFSRIGERIDEEDGQLICWHCPTS